MDSLKVCLVMFSIKVFWFLIVLVLGSYSILAILGQFEWFRKYKEAGATFAFDAILMMVALVTGFMGIWFNGYKRGCKDGKTEGNKT